MNFFIIRILLIISLLFTLIPISQASNNVIMHEVVWDNNQTNGVKSYVVKKSIRAISYALRNYSDDTLRKWLKIGTDDTKIINKIINEKHSLADKLDNIADNYDYATTSIRQGIYDALVWVLWHKISWALAYMLDLAFL